MKEYNYKNLADESNFGSQVYRAGMFDKILGIRACLQTQE